MPRRPRKKHSEKGVRSYLARRCISAAGVSLMAKPLARRLFGWLFPEDKGPPQCGYGVFKLPLDHPFTRGCTLHDSDYSMAHEGLAEKTKDITDWDLLWRWVLIARAEQDPARRIELVFDIIWYWPIARHGGNFMWDGD